MDIHLILSSLLMPSIISDKFKIQNLFNLKIGVLNISVLYNIYEII